MREQTNKALYMYEYDKKQKEVLKTVKEIQEKYNKLLEKNDPENLKFWLEIKYKWERYANENERRSKEFLPYLDYEAISGITTTIMVATYEIGQMEKALQSKKEELKKDLNADFNGLGIAGDIFEEVLNLNK